MEPTDHKLSEEEFDSKDRERGETPPDLEIDAEKERMLTVFTALDTIRDGDFTEEEAMDAYHITPAELAQHRPAWELLEIEINNEEQE